MLTNSPFFAGIVVDDLSKAKRFYGQTLGLDVSDRGTSLLTVHAANGYGVLLYEKPVHEPAAHTVPNFPVDDIEAAVDTLLAAGVEFEHYDSGPIKTNEIGIATPGPKQACSATPPATSSRSVKGSGAVRAR